MTTTFVPTAHNIATHCACIGAAHGALAAAVDSGRNSDILAVSDAAHAASLILAHLDGLRAVYDPDLHDALDLAA